MKKVIALLILMAVAGCAQTPVSKTHAMQQMKQQALYGPNTVPTFPGWNDAF